MNRLICAIVFLMAMTFAPARAQDSSETATSWQGQVEHFALALSTGAPLEDAAAPDAKFRRFGMTESESIKVLADLVNQARVISARAGTNPMISLASDLAADARAAELEARFLQSIDVPDNQRRNADSIAARWVAAELNAQTEDPIGLIVLFQPSEGAPQLHFILVKGRHDADGKFVIVNAVHATLSELLG